MAVSPPAAVAFPLPEPDRPDFPHVFGRYEIQGRIGRGGMGVVFKGFHRDLQRSVAIKTLRVDKISTSEQGLLLPHQAEAQGGRGQAVHEMAQERDDLAGAVRSTPRV